jgi:hypothetical protein
MGRTGWQSGFQQRLRCGGPIPLSISRIVFSTRLRHTPQLVPDVDRLHTVIAWTVLSFLDHGKICCVGWFCCREKACASLGDTSSSCCWNVVS